MAQDFNATPAHVIAQLTRLFSQAFQTRFAPHGVSPAQYPVLLHLWKQDGLTQHALCDLVGIEQPTMANTLKRMERDGLVRKVRDDNDRRKVRIRLTRRAANLREALNQSAGEVLNTVWAGFSPEEQHALMTLLGRMAANLEQDLEQDPLLLDQEVREQEGADVVTPEPTPPAPPPAPEEDRDSWLLEPPAPPVAEPAPPEPAGKEAPMEPGSLWPDQEDEAVRIPREQEPRSGPTPEFPYDPASIRHHAPPKPSDDESGLLILEEIYLAPESDIEQDACLPTEPLDVFMEPDVGNHSDNDNTSDSDEIVELTDIYQDKDGS